MTDRAASTPDEVAALKKRLAERRRSPRVELMGRLHGHAVSLKLDVTVREISLGGMAIETGLAFPVGAAQEFRLTLGDGSTTHLTGRVIHCRPETSPNGATIFVSGVEFTDAQSAPGSTIGDLIDKIK